MVPGNDRTAGDTAADTAAIVPTNHDCNRAVAGSEASTVAAPLNDQAERIVAINLARLGLACCPHRANVDQLQGSRCWTEPS